MPLSGDPVNSTKAPRKVKSKKVAGPEESQSGNFPHGQKSVSMPQLAESPLQLLSRIPTLDANEIREAERNARSTPAVSLEDKPTGGGWFWQLGGGRGTDSSADDVSSSTSSTDSRGYWFWQSASDGESASDGDTHKSKVAAATDRSGSLRLDNEAPAYGHLTDDALGADD